MNKFEGKTLQELYDRADELNARISDLESYGQSAEKELRELFLNCEYAMRLHIPKVLQVVKEGGK